MEYVVTLIYIFSANIFYQFVKMFAISTFEKLGLTCLYSAIFFAYLYASHKPIYFPSRSGGGGSTYLIKDAAASADLLLFGCLLFGAGYLWRYFYRKKHKDYEESTFIKIAFFTIFTIGILTHLRFFVTQWTIRV